MADKKITQLVDGGAPQATDEFVIARGGDNFKVDYASLESETLNDAVILAPASSARNVIQPTAGSVIAAIVKAHAAQSVDLTQWQTSAGVSLLTVGATGGVNLSPSSNVVPLSILGFGGAANLFEAYDSTQTYGIQVDHFGGLDVSQDPAAVTTALQITGGATNQAKIAFYAGTLPPDASFGSGTVGLWYDATNGAAKFMLKGKTADGTVVTWAIPNGTIATTTDLSAYVAKSLYDANSILAATTDDTPAALTVAASTILGRKASGNIAAMTATEAKAVLAIAESDVTNLTTDLADKVPKSLFDANTVLAADTDDTPAAVTMGASTILARLAAGNIKAASTAEIIALLQAYVVGGTDVALADGGTGASTAAAARVNLQLARRTSGYQVGQYYYGECIAAGGLGGIGNNATGTCYFVPFIVDLTTTFDRIACYITANGTAGSVVRMGIYNDNAGIPGTLLLDAGTVATDAGAAAIKAITISQQLTPGIYWLAVVSQVAAAQVRRNIPLGLMQPLSTDFNGSAVVATGITGALASNPTLTIAIANPTTVALRALSSP